MTGLWSRSAASARAPAPAPLLVAGPCVLDHDDINLQIAETVAGIGRRLGMTVVFKASFDKANRSRPGAARGPGLEAGLAALGRVRAAVGLPVVTDVHEVAQVQPAAAVVDALQVPAFLCRQTDLLEAVGASGLPVNIKKGQWMAPDAMVGAVEKVRRAPGSSNDIVVTERGTFFGYGDQVVDMRNFQRIRAAAGVPVLFDATHAVQRPGLGDGGASGGDREFVPALLLAAAAAGAAGFFLETHPRPSTSVSDGPTIWPLNQLESLCEVAVEVWHRAAPREVASVHA